MGVLGLGIIVGAGGQVGDLTPSRRSVMGSNPMLGYL